jgi:tripartite-type tricarboxylate transporter receptor subunit TctC
VKPATGPAHGGTSRFNTMKLHMALAGTLLSLAALCGSTASAQNQFQPTHPLRIVVPFGAGGSNDAQARIIAERLRAIYNQPVMVENKPGAGGIIGAAEVARAKPDGLTLLLSNTALIQVPLTNPAIKFDPLRDVVPLAHVSMPEDVFAIDSRLPYKTLAEFLQAAKQPNSNLSFGSAGYGQAFHLFGVMLNRSAGIDLLHVPYNGEAQIVNGLLGQQISSAFLTINAANPHIKAGTLRPLAVLSPTRFAALPNVPTFAENGVKGMDVVIFVGFFVPKGTPDTILYALNRDINAALTSKEVQQRFEAAEVHAGPLMEQPEFERLVKLQYTIWQDIINREGIRINDQATAK